MPVQKGKSGLVAKYGAKLDQAVQAHANDETDYGFQKVPAGITNGIAKVFDCKFDTYKTGDYTGEYYFQVRATVVEPESVVVNGSTIKVRGMQTMIQEPVCDTRDGKGKPTSQGDHIAKVLNYMRMLVDDSFTEGATVEDLEPLGEALKDLAPYTKFSTSESKPQVNPKTGKEVVNPKTGKPFPPRIWENWYGCKGLEDYTPPDASVSAVTDNTGNGQEESVPNSKNAKAEPNEEFNEFGDLGSLLDKAMDDNSPDQINAQNELGALALKAGHSQETIDNAENWKAVIALIESPASVEEESEEEKIGRASCRERV